MERIRLGKDEKKVLRMVAVGRGVCPSEYPSHAFNASVRSLEQKGLVKGAYEEGGQCRRCKDDVVRGTIHDREPEPA